ncbi:MULTISPECIES: 30S ribosome-binding factor RbfA [unclassified Prochlorococcus]|uniref:30S ribosome-binding factor RbfA n=1 Tax=unclassified Prochlorococcus TaxID=2627481 RepID=UPI0005339A66|nr:MULTISPECIES: 30S ribosome-binding factor RbfA [unclassified Prochlorococcus]KGG16825.1 Ribosome-binding factor A [Prochlorococcus sp. MIT 0602]KGG18201.1 Ribosome-binding factor A [Prochlorococcus sp. MIT 0603]
MAQSRRVEKVAALIRKEMSQLLLNGLRDQRVHSTMITITDVEVSGDLQHCKIFVSIFGDPGKIDAVFSALEASQVFLKGELGRRLEMRRAPEIIFKLDRGMEKGNSVLDLLGKLDEERKTKNQNMVEFQD